MLIQDEAPLPVSPLDSLEHDYHDAVLHIAWDRHAETGELTLLFAFVELLPVEVPPPLDDYDFKAPRSSHRLGNDSKHCVYVRHAVLPAREALAWYLGCRRGSAALPWSKTKTPLTLGELGEEPPWPTLISASDDSDALPFVPQWIHCPRTHHLVPLADFDRDRLWSAREQTEAEGWLEGRLHFELERYPVHLVAPNPVYRQLTAELQSREAPAESVLLRFQARAEKSVEGLEVFFRERDPWGVTAAQRRTVASPVMRVNFNREVNAIMEDVLDPRRGFLQMAAEAYPFFRNFRLKLGTVHQVAVQVQGQSYDVTRSGPPGLERSVLVGAEHKVAMARSRLMSAHVARERQRTAVSQGQRWFRGQKEEAREMLRSMLSSARSDVMLVDAYFGAAELVTFALAVSREDIPIRILSSAEVLKEKVSRGDDLEKGDQLRDAVEQVEQHKHMNPFEIRVMPGERPAIHDRFLSIDEHIWLLGASLNEFGSRGTMMLALPDPAQVRGDIEQAWNESQRLGDWMTQRRGAPGESSPA